MKPQFIRNVLIGILLCSIISLLLFGIIGIKRYGEFSFDFEVMYRAGKDWLSGNNPYRMKPSEPPFAYPPNSAFFFVPLALFNYNIAKFGHLFLNLTAIFLTIIMTGYTLRKLTNYSDSYSSLLMAAFIIGNPFTSHSVWLGQTSLISFAALMGAWIFNYQNRWILAGICLGIASFKPQLCVLVFLWFLLERNWKSLTVSTGVMAIMSIYPVLTQGFINTLVSWYVGLTTYKANALNAAGSQHVVGIESLINAAGLNSPNLKILGVICVVLLWWFRAKFNYFDILGIILGISLTFVYGHDGDYVCLVPLFTSLVFYARKIPKVWLALAPLVFLYAFPQRFIRVLEIPLLNHWRTVVVILIVSLVLALSTQNNSRFVHFKSIRQS